MQSNYTTAVTWCCLLQVLRLTGLYMLPEAVAGLTQLVELRYGRHEAWVGTASNESMPTCGMHMPVMNTVCATQTLLGAGTVQPVQQQAGRPFLLRSQSFYELCNCSA